MDYQTNNKRMPGVNTRETEGWFPGSMGAGAFSQYTNKTRRDPEEIHIKRCAGSSLGASNMEGWSLQRINGCEFAFSSSFVKSKPSRKHS